MLLAAALLTLNCGNSGGGARGPSPAPWPTSGVPDALLAKSGSEAESVSFLQPLGHSSVHDGKRVRVIGFAHVQFEGQGLYLHREDFENGLTKNAVWLDIDLEKPEFAALNGRYIIVEGTFKAGAGGHFGMYSGRLTEISRYDPWPTRAQLEAQGK